MKAGTDLHARSGKSVTLLLIMSLSTDANNQLISSVGYLGRFEYSLLIFAPYSLKSQNTSAYSQLTLAHPFFSSSAPPPLPPCFYLLLSTSLNHFLGFDCEASVDGDAYNNNKCRCPRADACSSNLTSRSLLECCWSASTTPSPSKSPTTSSTKNSQNSGPLSRFSLSNAGPHFR